MKSKIRIFFVGLGEFFKSLILRSHPSVTCHRGHEHIKAWDGCKECRIIEKELNRRELLQAPKTYLFAFDGPHAGEIRPLRGNAQHLGSRFDADYCVTPTEKAESKICFMDQQSKLRVSSSENHQFLVNNVMTQRAQLFDYDGVNIMGNSYLVLRSNKEFA